MYFNASAFALFSSSFSMAIPLVLELYVQDHAYVLKHNRQKSRHNQMTAAALISINLKHINHAFRITDFKVIISRICKF